MTEVLGCSVAGYVWGMLGGVVWNLANILLCKGIGMMGNAIGFPLCVGLGMVTGAIVAYAMVGLPTGERDRLRVALSLALWCYLLTIQVGSQKCLRNG
eukprot:Skav233749  [mRNA]  locus=scaffold1792:244268:246372:- [translate_table: standard]